MTLTIVVFNQQEEFLQFLDPELCSITETCTANALRTVEFEYKFQDMKEDKNLFKLGNKIWIQGDNNLTDCLYLINTSVREDIFKENSFTFEAEEVLVELTYAPLHSHTDITAANGFHLITENGQQMVRIDYNSLNFWFGDFFNIGVVQDCTSTAAQYISVTGTITPMALLRQIEEETGNVFITRYEKDVLNNTIHRYLDFLNPINVSKNWTLNLEYRFLNTAIVPVIYDENGNLVSDATPLDDKPYSDSMPEESLEEKVADATHDGEEDYTYTETEYSETWDIEEQTVEDEELEKDYTPATNLNPTNVVMRITHNGKLLNTDGGTYHPDTEETPLLWTASDIGFEDNTQTAVISLVNNKNKLGIAVNTKSFVIAPSNTTDIDNGYVDAIKNDTLNPVYIEAGDEPATIAIPDDSWFEFYDTVAGRSIFHTCLNTEIGTVHSEVLDLGFNLENVIHDIDETDTYSSVSPVLELNDTGDSSNGMTRTNLGNLIDRWKDLNITKGTKIPMIVQRINVKASSLENAKRSLGNYTNNSGANQSSSYSNWWIRPYKPQDQIDSNTPANSTWEFLRGTSYWKAPYNKTKGHLFIETDKDYLTEYTTIHRRSDRRSDKGMVTSPKNGTTTSTDEDIFQIYNQVALYLKEHEEPDIDLEIDVANLRGGTYNQYQIWDKVYIKIPDTSELITARVIETSKEAHDVAKNTIRVSNYQTKTVKTISKNMVIHAENTSFKYPASKTLTVQLENTDYDDEDEMDIQYPANKLLNFTLYTVENGSTTFKKNYTKVTNITGQASISMKYDPGDYKIEISFGGDEEFAETSTTIKVNVSGTKEVKKKTTTKKTTTSSKKKTSKSKTTKKTTKKTKTVKTYWSKCGLSPDKKKIIAVAKPSAGDGNYSYRLWKTQFKNYCPECKRSGYLRFDGGKKNKCISSSTYGHPWKDGVPEHEITCIKCDSDYDGVTGLEKDYGHSTRLKRLTKPKKSSQSEFGKLVKGQLVYGTKKVTVKTKKVKNTKTRKVVGKVSKKVKNQALSIVGNKTGYSAMKAIVKWMDKKIWYSRYSNFVRSPDTVLKKKHGNCCDQTRLFLQLCDAAGLTQYYKLYYCHVPGHVYAIVQSKKTGKKTYVDCASDYHTAWAYVCQGYSHGSPTSRYPTRPF